MIAADTSTLIAYFAGDEGHDVEALEECLQAGTLVLPPVVLAELLSDPNLPQVIESDLLVIPTLEATEGFWQRAGKLRRLVSRKGIRVNLADTLISQFCLDHRVGLITRDRDFARFRDAAQLFVIGV